MGRLTDKFRSISKGIKDFGKELELSSAKLASYWSYGNQITSLVMRNLAMGAEGTEEQARMQVHLGRLASIQAQVAVGMTFLQSKAAFAAGNIPSGIALAGIGTMMELSVLRADDNVRQQKENAAYMKKINAEMESWS